MSTTDNTRTQVQDDVIELGVASVETLGSPPIGAPVGGTRVMGISHD